MRTKILLLFFALGTISLFYIMGVSGKPLKTTITPHGILDLEFAYNKHVTEKVIGNWHNLNVRDDAKENIFLDFIFLLFYAPFLFLLCSNSWLNNNSRNYISKLIARSCLFAGVFDILENFGMLESLNGNLSDTISVFTISASITKWMLVAIAILFILFLLIRKLLIKIINHPT